MFLSVNFIHFLNWACHISMMIRGFLLKFISAFHRDISNSNCRLFNYVVKCLHCCIRLVVYMTTQSVIVCLITDLLQKLERLFFNALSLLSNYYFSRMELDDYFVSDCPFSTSYS